jgi:hypothetical protein
MPSENRRILEAGDKRWKGRERRRRERERERGEK